MKLYKLSRYGLITILSLLTYLPVCQAQNKVPYRNMADAILSESYLAGKSGPQSVNWIDGGNRYSYTQYNEEKNQDEIRAYNPKTGKDVLIFDASNHTFPDTTEPFQYRSFQWAHDSRHLLFQTNFRKLYRHSGFADYYIYSLGDKSLKLAVKDARTAELSPDGSMIGYERGGNMYVYDFSTQKEKQLTNDATKLIFNGHFDWVYQEEFSIVQAWKWSPDNQYIAYWQVNESKEPVAQMTNFQGLHPKYVKIRYPQVGDPNPIVKIGVVNVKTGKKIWLNTGLSGDFYIPRIYWTSEKNTLAVITLNRAQDHLKLFFFNVETGQRRLVMEQKSDTWIDVADFYAGVHNYMIFPKGIHEFFWMSDKDGWQHIYRYNYDGKLLDQVTHGNWCVTRIDGIDTRHKTIYYTSTENSPLQRQLYSIRFNGSHKKQLTKIPGDHEFNMSPNTKYYIDTWSNVSTPTHVDLRSTKGKLISELVSNNSVNQYIKRHVYSPRTLFHFTTSDGQKLDAYMIKPMNFDPSKKYPVIMAVYGGPGSQAVYDKFETNGFHQYLAQEGYIIVDVNNRGSNNYGSKFEKIVYKHLGKWESHDFVETANYLKKLPYVDGNNIAIMGTSYGGYITTYTLTTHPGVYKLGIADSPPTDWRLYDSIYTERYMGLLSDNKEGYIQSASTTHAKNLQDYLLLVHSMMDDNVHVRNTMQFLTALINAGKDADLRIYPLGAHGAEYSLVSDILLHKVYNRYLNRHLKDETADTPVKVNFNLPQ